MREVEPWHFSIMRLFMRCRAWNVLPYPGGLTEQPEHIMRMFDVLDRVREEYKVAELERTRREAERKAGKVGKH